MILQIFLKFFLVINRALEARFRGGYHVARKCHIRCGLDHKNQVFKTRFMDQNRASKTRDASKKNILETLTTN